MVARVDLKRTSVEQKLHHLGLDIVEKPSSAKVNRIFVYRCTDIYIEIDVTRAGIILYNCRGIHSAIRR